MKTTFKLAFVACLMVLSSACHAQEAYTGHRPGF